MARLSACVHRVLNVLVKVGLDLCLAVTCTISKHLLLLPTVIQGFIFDSGPKLLKRKRNFIYLDFTNREFVIN